MLASGCLSRVRNLLSQARDAGWAAFAHGVTPVAAFIRENALYADKQHNH
jgi:hypothetical protein